MGSFLQYKDQVESAAAQNGVPFGLLTAVSEIESSWNPNAVSPAGALGLMQLMPSTAAALGVTDPFDPQQSLNGGARYLRQQLDTFGSWPLALAAYNAGPGTVQQYGRVPPIPETQAYVNKVLSLWQNTYAFLDQGSAAPPSSPVLSILPYAGVAAGVLLFLLLIRRRHPRLTAFS